MTYVHHFLFIGISPTGATDSKALEVFHISLPHISITRQSCSCSKVWHICDWVRKKGECVGKCARYCGRCSQVRLPGETPCQTSQIYYQHHLFHMKSTSKRMWTVYPYLLCTIIYLSTWAAEDATSFRCHFLSDWRLCWDLFAASRSKVNISLLVGAFS